MNDTSENNINLVSNPASAVEEFVGEPFVEWLLEYIKEQMKNWPSIAALHTQQARIEKVRKLMLQLFTVDCALIGSREGDPGFLRFAIANLSEAADPTAESALEILEKRRLDELNGHKLEKGIILTQNRNLWTKLLSTLEIPEEEINRTEPKEAARNFIAELSDVYSNSDWQEAVGAFAASNTSLEIELPAVIGLIKNNATVTDSSLEVLLKKTQTNKYRVESNHLLEKLSFDKEVKQLVFEGVNRFLSLKKDLLEDLVKHLETAPV